ncbi:MULTISPECIES: ATP-binding protein [Pasteurellaceae]|uniref:ATP-binding protein n=1 Tax=Pasteurella atlantica TaxID=2827233 RepID=A0AAW8CGA3_9PAST|nr:ATP-binding protein [Pasteurella atlantica]MBR0574012.1 ATP-binding protein [Pasteurella atlantica]MDP8039974.1 ATP-binding protein [Pasteurella atlantica]MDP8042088.1 ATP-binding protein [Pasteurella atlantica]MDP8044276.1 ATP-binding protein [Pasteurella atlantica]MDP8046287.1 ATP-binding protein [Pasteurella atlantica]
MKYVVRPKYTKKIEKFVDKPVIKVLTGMRRVGKSTILTIIKNEILATIPTEQKIYINFESLEFLHINDANALAKYLTENLKGIKGKVYFFFDEIQLVKNWEKVINGLRVDRDCDIYITGSNSKLISGELATLLAGRYVEFEIQPFTFDEFLMVYTETNLNRDELFNKFLQVGGMPILRYFNLEEETSYKYLQDVYNTVLVKDVLNYNKIRDVDIFNRILNFVIQNIGATFSASSIKKYLKSESREVSVDTVLNYLEYCQMAFIIKKVPRYDLVGKKTLKIDEKYYLTDHGFRQSKGYSNIKDIEKTLENIVYIELISRGYQVEIGKVGAKEIDFIARKDKEIIYYQVSYLMATEQTREREFGVYKNISDNYPKYVLSMDKVDFSQDGIIHQNIMDFLLQ